MADLKVTFHASEVGTIYSDIAGNMYWSQSSLARACKIDRIYVRRAISSGDIFGQISAEIHTETGVRGGDIIPAVGCGASAFITKHNTELAAKLQDIGVTVFLQEAAGIRKETGVVAEQLQDAWRIIRDFHKFVWHKNITPGEANKLHMMVFGMTVKEHKSMLPAFAALDDDAKAESLLPDMVSIKQLEEITKVRANFVKAKQSGYANPYLEAIA